VARRIRSIEISSDLIRNGTHGLPACRIVITSWYGHRIYCGLLLLLLLLLSSPVGSNLLLAYGLEGDARRGLVTESGCTG
jgi:hypothetical protein